MKKTFIAIVSIFILVIAFGGYKFWQYYQDTYVGQEYYGVIKEPLPSEQTINDKFGDPLGQGFVYQLNAVNLKGQERELELEVITTGEYKNGEEIPVGTLFKIEASNKRIIKKSEITEKEIPAEIKARVLN